MHVLGEAVKAGPDGAGTRELQVHGSLLVQPLAEGGGEREAGVAKVRAELHGVARAELVAVAKPADAWLANAEGGAEGGFVLGARSRAAAGLVGRPLGEVFLGAGGRCAPWREGGGAGNRRELSGASGCGCCEGGLRLAHGTPAPSGAAGAGGAGSHSLPPSSASDPSCTKSRRWPPKSRIRRACVRQAGRQHAHRRDLKARLQEGWQPVMSNKVLIPMR